jgi:hypothetical protein
VRFTVVRSDGPSAEKAAFKDAAIDGHYKLIVDRRTGHSELYDLERDPGERENLAESQPDVRRRMEAWLDRTRGDAPHATSAPEVPVDPQQLEELRKLGYVDD